MVRVSTVLLEEFDAAELAADEREELVNEAEDELKLEVGLVLPLVLAVELFEFRAKNPIPAAATRMIITTTTMAILEIALEPFLCILIVEIQEFELTVAA